MFQLDSESHTTRLTKGSVSSLTNVNPMNGESYNYANENNKEHDRLDSKSTKFDYSLRKEIKER